MSEVIFAQTRQHYAPYDDFYRLARLSRFDVVFLDEVNWRDSNLTVICPVKHPEWDAVIPPDHQCRFIWWTFERGRDDQPPMDMSNPYRPPYVDEVWASDRAYAESIGARYVFLGGHRSYGAVNVQEKKYDIVTLMYYSPRRQQLGNDLERRFGGANVSLWGDERHERLIASRLMVTAHQDGKPWSEPIRFMLAGCYALPLLSEFCQDAGYWVPGQNYLAAPLNDLANQAALVLQHDILRARIGATAWRLVCVERPFRQEVEAAL